MTTTEFYERIRFRGQPVAHPDATVVFGNARFTVLTPRLLRMEWAEIGQFEDRCTYAFPSRYTATPPAITTRKDNDMLIIETGALTLRYGPEQGPFTAANLSVKLTLNGTPVVWMPGTPNPQNLRGTRRTLDGCEGEAALEEGLLSRAGWTLFDDSRNVIFDNDGWVGARPEFALQDWYFFGYGHDYQAAIAEYTQFGGQVPLIPRYILGGWWSRYWAYSEQDLRALVAEFEEHDVPLDVFVIDMDWHTPNGWTGYTWNRDLFPAPPAFLKWLHSKGLRVTLNLHPADGVQPHETIYPEFAKALGIDPESKQPVPFRIANKDYVKHYFEMLHHPMEDDGVDFWWMDWQQGEISEVKGLDPLPWINHLHFNDIKRHTGPKGSTLRPMLYSRWGGLGNHRYYIGFSGDTFVRWTALQFQPHLTATSANVGYGWWSHDIGGHMGGATDPELYTRWVQFGAVSPVLRLHATKDPRAERRPWAYPQPYADAAITAFHLRYKLTPYLYTMARRAHDTGLALCRPMYYEHPEDDSAYLARYQYYLGTDIIAAPFVFPRDATTGLAHNDVWIPAGTWIAWDTLETFEGPTWVRLWGDLNRIPLLIRAGSILPLAADFAPASGQKLASGTIDAQPKDKLTLDVFPGSGEFRYYEDDGVSENYREGQHEWTTMHTDQPDAHTWSVEIAPVEGCCDALPAQRSYDINLRGCTCPLYILINGDPAGEWSYDEATLTATATVPKQLKSQPVKIVATTQGPIVAIGTRNNWLITLAEIECLLGETCASEILEPGSLLEWEKLTEAEAEAFSQAVARLGGPFASILEYATPEEAGQQLGHVIIAAPLSGDPYNAEVTFTRRRGGRADTTTSHFTHTTATHILPTPFAADVAAPMQWEAFIRLEWRGVEIRTIFHSAPLFPAIPRWQAVIYDSRETPLAAADVLDEKGRPNPGLKWRTYAQTIENSVTFQRAHFVMLQEGQLEALKETPTLAAYLTATVTSLGARAAIFEFTSHSPVTIILNGQPVAENFKAAEDSALGRFVHGTRQTVPVRLQAGENTLLIHCPAEYKHWPFWFFGGAFVTLDGELIIDLK